MIEKAKVTYRVGMFTWIDDYHFKNFNNLISEYKDRIDEIAYGIGFTHLPLPLDYIEDITLQLKPKMAETRKLGLRVGVNHAATIGHQDENLEHSLKGDYGYILDCKGFSSHVLCVSNPSVQEYIRQSYIYLAKSEPDFIWIDDDVRIYGHSEGYYECFCDKCIEAFNNKMKTDYTSDSLKYAFDNGTVEEKKKVRKSWMEFNSDKIALILSIIREAVDSVDSKINVGYMTATLEYENNDQKRFSDVLSHNNTIDTMWRPGGGFYNDWNLKELYKKTNFIGRQIAPYPNYVTDIQSEVENFPCNHLHKSIRMNVLETCCYVCAGCTGTTYNALSADSTGSLYDTSNENRPRFEMLKYQDFVNELVRVFQRNDHNGVFIECNNYSLTAQNMEAGKWLVDMNKDYPFELFENGIPQTYYKDKAVVTLLLGDEPYSLNNEEIIKLLSSGVFMDAKALNILNKLGYGEYTGFKVGKEFVRDTREVFKEHYINDGFVGYKKDARQAFCWGLPSTSFIPNENAEILTSLIDYLDNEVAACSTGIFENSLGGRICVAGYFPNTMLQSLPKAIQTKRLVRYLSNDKLTSYIDSYHNMLVFDRSILESEHIAIGIMNNSLDSIFNIELCILGDIKSVNIVDMNMVKTLVEQVSFDGIYSKFIIPEMEMFSMVLVSN